MTNEFTRESLESLLDVAMGRTLGEVDSKHLIDRYVETRPDRVVKGVPGDIIEQSVLGLPKDSLQKADLLVDGTPTELKVTGVYKRGEGAKAEYYAKERLTITNVNYSGVVQESFIDSHLWEKIQNILLVYYQYGDTRALSTEDYRKFRYLLYSNLHFSDEEREIIKSDWEHVHGFFASERGQYVIGQLQDPQTDDEERRALRAELSAALGGLMYLEVAPKFPRARLAIKNSYFKVKTKEIFSAKASQQKLAGVSGYSDLLQQISKSVEPYIGMKLGGIAKEAAEAKSSTLADRISKGATNYILGYMLTGDYVKASSIEELAKAGFIVKTVPIKDTGHKKEDSKLTPVMFSEFEDDTAFEDSTLFDYLFSHRFLCGVFERHQGRDRSLDIFRGVKVIEFSDSMLEESARKVWETMRRMYLQQEMTTHLARRKDGTVIYNKNGFPKMGNNLPKSKEYEIFIRGTSGDSSKKPLVLNGHAFYNLDYWIKGSLMVELLNKSEFL